MNTFMAKPAELVRNWHIIDAKDMTLGRLATAVTDLLTGKLKPIYTPHVDCGDYVVVINSDKIVLTGKKLTDKFLRWHSGYPSGLKEMNYKTLMQTNSSKALQVAVKGMLQKNSLGRKQITRLFVYKDEKHQQQAQQPKPYTIKGARK